MIYRLVKTKWGWCGLVGEVGKVSRLFINRINTDSHLYLREIILKEYEGAEEDRGAFAKLAAQLVKYFQGKPVKWHTNLIAPSGTVFQRKVWRAAMKIRYGETRTYGWLALHIGAPRASRAVGNALGRNPIPIIIPCHRVIRSDGSLGGFSAQEGVSLKKRLIEMEARSCR